jgi:hypothetical protein
MHKDVTRLAALLACIALATSRIGLIGHELLGHGGVALALGGTITDVKLFWFAGGWIRYQLPETSLAGSLAIAMAGIAVELVSGITLWLAVRGDALGRRITRGIGLALVVHATWYLATGAWHGFGDGLLLYRVLGGWRVPVAIAAGLATCAAAFAGAREVLGALAHTIGGSRRARIAGTAIAIVIGAGLHAALAAGEVKLRQDTTYGAVMQPERERVIARELVQWQRDQAAHGIEVTSEARRAQVRRLESTHKTFPFVWLLAACTAAAVLAGARLGKRAPASRIDSRLLAITAAVAIGSILTVVILDGFFVAM